MKLLFLLLCLLLPTCDFQSATCQELGSLHVKPIPQKTGALLLRTGYFRTSNFFSRIDDGLIISDLVFWTQERLGQRTTLLIVADNNRTTYPQNPEFDYQGVSLSLGIQQRLLERTYVEARWAIAQFTRILGGDSLLKDNSFYLIVSRRDELGQFWLNTRYEGRISLADPSTRSRVVNSIQVSLNYAIKGDLRVGLDYQYAITKRQASVAGIALYIGRDRTDEYHRLLGRLTYVIDPRSQVSLQVGLSQGNSTDARVEEEDLFLAVTYSLELTSF